MIIGESQHPLPPTVRIPPLRPSLDVPAEEILSPFELEHHAATTAGSPYALQDIIAAPHRHQADPESDGPDSPVDLHTSDHFGTMSSTPVIEEETPRHSRLWCRVIVWCLVVALCFPIIIFLAIPATMSPTFDLDPASSLSSFNVSGSGITTEWTLVFSVENPSKLVQVKYKHVKATIYLDSTPLARAKIGPFVQKPASHTKVRANFHSTLPRANELSVKSLVAGLGHGEVRVDVVLSSGRRLGLGAWWVPAFDVSITCNDVTFTAESDGGGLTLLAGTSYCILGFFGYV